MILTLKEFEYLEIAKAIAAWAHKGQTRKKSNTPYITHPVRVASMGAALGYPLHAQIALLGHDIGEDGPEEVNQDMVTLEQKFVRDGIPAPLAEQAVAIIDDLTKRPGEGKVEYIERLEEWGDDYAVLGKVLDRIDNLREGQASMGKDWLRKYLISTRRIITMADKRGFTHRPEVQYLIKKTGEAEEFVSQK